MAKLKANTGEQTQGEDDLRDYIQKRDDEAYRFLLRTAEGRWFIIRLLQQEGLTASSFTGNSSTFFNEGRRAVVIAIRDKIESLGREELSLLHQAEDEFYEASQILKEEMEKNGH